MENQTEPVFIFAKWQIKDGQLSTILDLLPTLMEESKKESGNLFYNIFQDKTEPNTLILHESYKDMASIESHKNSDHYQNIAVKQIIPLLENRDVILATKLDFSL